MKLIANKIIKKIKKLKTIYFSSSIVSNIPQNSDTMKDKNGFVYVAFGESYTKEALMSIRSLKRFHSEPIAIFTDIPELKGLDELVDLIYTIKPNHIRAKVDFIQKAPFKKNIYLDSDTIIVENISDIFDLLTKFDIAFTIDSARKRQNISDKINEYDVIPYSFPEVNGGIFAFKSSDKIIIFLKKWREYFYKFFTKTHGWDQPSLRIALWESDLRLSFLPPEYNVRSRDLVNKIKNSKDKLGNMHMKTRIYHMHYSNDVHQGKFKILSLGEMEKIVKKKAIKIIY